MENIAELIIFNNFLYKISFKTFPKESNPKKGERKNVLMIQLTWHGSLPGDGVWRGHQGRGADDGGSSGLAGSHGGLAHTHCLLPRSFHYRTYSRWCAGSCSFRLLTRGAKKNGNEEESRVTYLEQWLLCSIFNKYPLLPIIFAYLLNAMPFKKIASLVQCFQHFQSSRTRKIFKL